MNPVQLLPQVQDFLNRNHGHFIDGAPTLSQGQRIPVVNPTTAETIATVANATESDVAAAVNSSRRAFEGSWGEAPPASRASALLRLADLLLVNGNELAQLETLQSGKTLQLSRHFEIEAAATFLRHYAGAATRITGQTINPSLSSLSGEKYSALTLRKPLGVVAGVVPWNFSILIAVWKFASALATGCTSVIKPSEYTPLTALRIAELAIEAGVPPGVLNVVNGRGSAGQALIEHPNIAKVSFTGSVPTGISVGRAAVSSKLTRFTLELGGKNSVGFLKDVDAEKAAAGVLEAGFIHQGQVCAAGERFFVHRTRMDEVLEKVSKALSSLTIGDPLDSATQFGPLSNRPHFERVSAFFDQARSGGDQIVHGGKVMDRPGYFVEPTLVLAGSRTSTLLTQETFGPIGTFLPYDDEDELLSLFNETDFGLSASLWTNDLSKAMRMVPKIEAGTVWVNMHSFLDPAVPFGGVKSSGVGREFGDAFINDYTELQSVIIRY